MDLTKAAGTVSKIQEISGEILGTISAVDPAIAPEAEAAAGLVSLFGALASKALSAWSDASGTPITAESVQALLPNAAPLSAPTE